MSQDTLNYQLYRSNVTDSAVQFTGLPGPQYHFFSLATDNTGNREQLKQSPDTSIILFNSAPVITFNNDTVSTLSVAGCGADSLTQCIVVTDAEHNPVHYTITQPPLYGQASFTYDATGVCLKYIADSASSGTDSLLLSACDPSNKCDSAWFVYYINLSLVWYADADSDGYGTPGNISTDCEQPAGYVSNNDDCNDTDATVHFNIPEVCSNGIDDNCNGEIDEGCGGVVLNVRMFIEGYYQFSNQMMPVLFNSGIYNNNSLCDFITVELHDSLSPHSLIVSQQAIVNKDGYAVVHLPTEINGEFYYIVVRSRNAIETWSKVPVIFSLNTTFDFTE